MGSNTLPQFFDVEVRILSSGSEAYPIEITFEDGAVARGTVPRAALTWESGSDSRKDGQRLFNALLADWPLREAWGAIRSKSCRIRLRIDPPELHALPWEFLHDGRAVLAASASTPFSRYLPIDLPWGQPVSDRPVRVLAAVSNPSDLQSKYNLAAADVALEKQILQEALNRAGIALEFLEAPASLQHLEEKLREGYHVLHLVAHGAFYTSQKRSALLLENEAGATQRVNDDDFVEMLSRLQQQRRPTLIVLAACQSATRSTDDALIGLGPKLVQAGMPAVVAMQDLVTVATARQFSATLYDQLLNHSVIDLAVNEARGTLLTTGRPDAAVPVLFMRLKDGRLWKGPAQAQTTISPAAPRTAASPSVDAVNFSDPVALRKHIVTRYSLEEIRTLCSDIGVDYDNLAGEGKEAKARELISFLKRRGKLDDLIRYLQEDRGE